MAEKDALLELKVTREKNSHLILIRDNGPGTVALISIPG